MKSDDSLGKTYQKITPPRSKVYAGNSSRRERSPDFLAAYDRSSDDSGRRRRARDDDSNDSNERRGKGPSSDSSNRGRRRQQDSDDFLQKSSPKYEDSNASSDRRGQRYEESEASSGRRPRRDQDGSRNRRVQRYEDSAASSERRGQRYEESEVSYTQKAQRYEESDDSYHRRGQTNDYNQGIQFSPVQDNYSTPVPVFGGNHDNYTNFAYDEPAVQPMAPPPAQMQPTQDVEYFVPNYAPPPQPFTPGFMIPMPRTMDRLKKRWSTWSDYDSTRYCFGCFASKSSCVRTLCLLFVVIVGGIAAAVYFFFPKVPTVTVSNPFANGNTNALNKLIVSDPNPQVAIQKANPANPVIFTLPLSIDVNVFSPNKIEYAVKDLGISVSIIDPDGTNTLVGDPIGSGKTGRIALTPEKNTAFSVPFNITFKLLGPPTELSKNPQLLALVRICAPTLIQGLPPVAKPNTVGFRVEASVSSVLIDWTGFVPKFSQDIYVTCPPATQQLVDLIKQQGGSILGSVPGTAPTKFA